MLELCEGADLNRKKPDRVQQSRTFCIRRDIQGLRVYCSYLVVYVFQWLDTALAGGCIGHYASISMLTLSMSTDPSRMIDSVNPPVVRDRLHLLE